MRRSLRNSYSRHQPDSRCPSLFHMRLLLSLCPLLGFVIISVARTQVAVEYAPPTKVNILPQNPRAAEPDMLFYFSDDYSLDAGYATGGNPVPNYVKDVKILSGCVRGPYI